MSEQNVIYIKKDNSLKRLFSCFFASKKLPPHRVKYDYNIPDKINFKLELTKDGYTLVTSPDLPGFYTQAKDTKSLYEMINDAVLTYFRVPRTISDGVFDTIHIEGFGTIASKDAIKALA